MTNRRPSRQLRALALAGAGVLAAGAALASLNGAASASPAPGVRPRGAAQARPWVSGDHTIPYYRKARSIHEVVDVETGMDSDRDGKVDTIRVDISRPDTAKGQKVPLIVHASPYFSEQARSAWETGLLRPARLRRGDGGAARHGLLHRVRRRRRQPRGARQQGDRRLGERSGQGSLPRREAAVATKWTNGKIGMIGVSWDGTIANAVASTGVEGLETIVPVAAISQLVRLHPRQRHPVLRGPRRLPQRLRQQLRQPALCRPDTAAADEV